MNGLSAVWDWILEHETFCLIVLTIFGIVAAIFGSGIVAAMVEQSWLGKFLAESFPGFREMSF